MESHAPYTCQPHLSGRSARHPSSPATMPQASVLIPQVCLLFLGYLPTLRQCPTAAITEPECPPAAQDFSRSWSRSSGRLRQESLDPPQRALGPIQGPVPCLEGSLHSEGRRPDGSNPVLHPPKVSGLRNAQAIVRRR